MKHVYRLLILMMVMLLFASRAEATTKTLYPSEDSYLNGIRAGINSNYGSLPTIRMGDAAGVYFLPLLHFPFDSIPTNQIVTSAKFRLYFRQTLNDSNLASGEFVIIPIGTVWDEQTVVWVNRPSKNIEGIMSERLTVVNKEAGYQEWDITSLVQRWINHPELNYGFYVEPKTNGWSCGFDSGEGQYSPKLIVEYGFSFPTLIKPVIKFIPGLVGASPTPEPVAQPTPTPQVVASPTITPLPSPSPSPAPTLTPSATPRAIDEPNPSPTTLVSQPPTERAESPAPLLVPGILGFISLLSIIGSFIIIKLLRNRKTYARNRAKPRNKKRSGR